MRTVYVHWYNVCQLLPVTKSSLFMENNSDVIVNLHICHISCKQLQESFSENFTRLQLEPSSDYSVSSWSRLVFVLVRLTYFDYNLFCSLSLCLLHFSILSERGKILREKKVHIVGQLTLAQYCCLPSFLLSSSILFYHIYLYVGIYFFYYSVLSWFSLKHMTGYPQSQLQ